MFEGEYLNEKRWNGRRMCRLKDKFIQENIKYEVEILKGKLWNGKIYDSNNNIICDWKEGKGFIKEYNDYGELRFEGEYLNGERHGKGKEYEDFEGNIKFEGEYLYGCKRKGRSYMNGVLEYEGEYLYGKKYNGKGYDEKGNIIYELKNGNGTIKEYDYYNHLMYEGEYLNRERNGKGKEYYYRGNLIFEGEYLNGKEWNGKKFYDF